MAIKGNITIREGSPFDFQPVLALIHEFSIFQRTPERVTVTIGQMKAAGSLFKFYVAETGEHEIVGFASYFFAWYSWSGKTLYLDDLFVQSRYRKMGIGRELFDSIINTGRIEQCVKVRWQVSRWNTDAIKYYEKLGAVVDETELNCELYIQTKESV